MRLTKPVRSRQLDQIELHTTVPFVLMHVACLGAIWTGVHTTDLLIAAGLYFLRMFGVTAGYHRYFSHRSFKTSRAFRFVLALLAQSSAQRGILWWAAAHRHHHRFSDMDDDVHSPLRSGFWFSHLGWIFTRRYARTDLAAVRDLAKSPELLWLDRHPYLPAVLTGLAVWLLEGWSGLVVGFIWSTVAVWHATFAINSLAHVVGRQRYLTGDQSRNNWWLALLTLGEGWHNNHHHFPSAARQGFRWYEFDISYYALRGLAAVRVVWDLRSPPRPVVRSEQRLSRAVVEKAAGQLAASFSVERMATELRTILAAKRASLDTAIGEVQDDLAAIVDKWHHQLDDRLDTARHELEMLMHRLPHPAVPTVADLRVRAGAMFVRSPSLNDIVERARQMLIEDLCWELAGKRTAAPA